LIQGLRSDPANLMKMAGMPPDSWQTNLLRSNFQRLLLLCSRQAGKTTVAAALVLKEILLNPPALVLILSPTQRQSGEVFRRVKDINNALGRPVKGIDQVFSMELANGSRVIALPGEEKTIRVFSGVKLLVIDEAARVDDALYHGVSPMLAVSKGKMVCLSTPFGKRGFFYREFFGIKGEEATSSFSAAKDCLAIKDEWRRVMVTADQCPRIPREYLALEKATKGERYYNQEFACSFVDMVGAVFSAEDIQAMIDSDVQPLFPMVG
jgi:hypothetical protein